MPEAKVLQLLSWQTSLQDIQCYTLTIYGFKTLPFVLEMVGYLVHCLVKHSAKCYVVIKLFFKISGTTGDQKVFKNFK